MPHTGVWGPIAGFYGLYGAQTWALAVLRWPERGIGAPEVGIMWLGGDIYTPHVGTGSPAVAWKGPASPTDGFHRSDGGPEGGQRPEGLILWGMVTQRGHRPPEVWLLGPTVARGGHRCPISALYVSCSGPERPQHTQRSALRVPQRHRVRWSPEDTQPRTSVLRATVARQDPPATAP